MLNRNSGLPATAGETSGPSFRERFNLPGIMFAILLSPGSAAAAEVEIAWDAVDDDRVSVYEVHWGEESGDYQWHTQSQATHAKVDGLVDGRTYHFAAKACTADLTLCSEFSEELAATIAESAPSADFDLDVTTGTAPLTVTFSSAASTGTIDAYAWDFGDGGTSSEPSPSYTYTRPGSYDVTLTVDGPGGSSTALQSGAVSVSDFYVTPAQPCCSTAPQPGAGPPSYPPPVPNFTESVTSGPSPLTVTFSNDSSGEIDSYLWDFGDGGSSTAATAVYTFDTAGTYTVSLDVTGPGGSSVKTKSDLITVSSVPPPVAAYTADPVTGSAPLAVQFSDASSGDVTSYSWSFGDGNTSSARNPNHAYDTPGQYDVTLTVAGPGGTDVHTESRLVTVLGEDLPIEVGEITIDHAWQRVALERSFTDPVVIVTPVSHNGGDPVMARIDNIDSTGFSVRLQEWAYLDDRHMTEVVGYVVVERGMHQLPNGAWLEADRIDNVAGGAWHFGPFAAPFSTTPVVLSSMNTLNDASPAVTRLREIDAGGFEVTLQAEERNAAPHASESIGYIAWEPSCGEVNGLRFAAGQTLDEVTHDPAGIIFADACNPIDGAFNAAPVLLADMQTTDGPNTANLRWTNKGAYSVDVWVDEEQSRDTETDHTTEVVGYLAIREHKPTEPLVIELGELAAGDQWQWVELSQQFIDPVVIAKLMSADDPEPAILRIKDVSNSGFALRVQEWDYLDGAHPLELVGYMVVERGRHQLPNGAWLEAGRTTTDATGTFVGIDYTTPFSTDPVVVTAVTTYHGGDAVTTRVRNISASGFETGMIEQESNAHRHVAEAIDYVAIEPSIVTLGGLQIEAGRTADIVTHAPQTVDFALAAARPPIVLADMQTADGGDTSVCRVDQIDQYSMRTWVQEEQSNDSEIAHTNEAIGYIVFD